MDGGDVVASSRVDVLYETAKDFGGSDFGGSENRKAFASINPEKDYSVVKGPFATSNQAKVIELHNIDSDYSR